MTARFRFFCAALFVLLLAGCTVGPNFHRPPANAPMEYRGDTTGLTNSLAEMPWWQLFQDETLQALIRTALTNNYDLRIAVTRVEQATAVLAQNRSLYFPQVGYEGAFGAGKNVANGAPSYLGGETGKGYFVAADASWEIDLWGRLRRLNESARAQFLATQEARREVMITLIATVAEDYFQLLALDEEVAIARDSTNSFAQSFKLFSQQLRGGVASKLETSSAEAALDVAAATIPELERQIAVEENQIRLLLGQNPGPILRHHRLLEELLPPDVPPGLPSALLERRPDIREEEQLARAANAQIGVAKANFYPALSLTALFGKVSPELSLFTSGATTAWSVAADLTGPIFEGGLLKAQLAQARAAWKETVLEYQSTVINAFQEISNALIARDQLARERLAQAAAVQAYRIAVTVANQRYAAGHANYYEVLQEEQELFPAENVLAQTEVNQLMAVVQLYRALGGGWAVPPQH